MEKQKQQKRAKAPTEKALRMLTEPYNDLHDNVIADPNGSYTGICDPKYELPVQDADDL